jgi:hypothetical protein
MNKAEALAYAKLLFGDKAWVGDHGTGTAWVFEVGSDPKCRIRVTGRSWEEALILAEDKLFSVNGQNKETRCPKCGEIEPLIGCRCEL